MGQASAHPQRVRLFVGLWPGEAVRDEIVDHARRWTWPPQARLTRRERLHLTLCFLGELPVERIPEVVERLPVRFEPFELRLGEAEVWSGGQAVLRPLAVPAPLQVLHDRLGWALRWHAAPWLPRRSGFAPHVTLARDVRAALPPARVLPIAWPVTAYTLIESDLRPPARYRVLYEYP